MRDRRNTLAAQADVKDSCVGSVHRETAQGLLDGPHWPDNLEASAREDFVEVHGDEEFIFDNQHPEGAP